MKPILYGVLGAFIGWLIARVEIYLTRALLRRKVPKPVGVGVPVQPPPPGAVVVKVFYRHRRHQAGFGMLCYRCPDGSLIPISCGDRDWPPDDREWRLVSQESL